MSKEYPTCIYDLLMNPMRAHALFWHNGDTHRVLFSATDYLAVEKLRIKLEQTMKADVENGNSSTFIRPHGDNYNVIGLRVASCAVSPDLAMKAGGKDGRHFATLEQIPKKFRVNASITLDETADPQLTMQDTVVIENFTGNPAALRYEIRGKLDGGVLHNKLDISMIVDFGTMPYADYAKYARTQLNAMIKKLARCCLKEDMLYDGPVS